MRILFLYKTRSIAYNHFQAVMGNLFFYRTRLIPYNNHLHLDFFRAIAKHARLFMYGPYVDKDCPDIALTKYNKRYDIRDLVSMCNPDIIIIGNKARMLNNPKCVGCYNRVNCTSCPQYATWLPKDFAMFNKIAKVVIEVDYHYEKDETWYSDHNIDLILQRHYSQFLRQESIPMRWLPFAINTDIFRPNNNLKRINRICFCGSRDGFPYKIRSEMTKRLKESKLLDDKGRVYGNSYVKCLQSYVSHLSCSSLYDLTIGKTLEIAASGSALLTNTFSGIDKLFNTKKQCYIPYKSDGSDVVHAARMILNDRALVSEITSNAIKHVKDNHTYAKRIKELTRILESVL